MSETHEAQMSPQTHLYLHNTIGLRYSDGLAVGDHLQREVFHG